MGQSRRLSRSSRSNAQRRDDAQARASASSPIVARPSSIDAGTRTDPDRLIEDAFRARDVAEAPDTLVLAWLALLGKPDDAPLAASRLATRLLATHTGRMSFCQARLIELLAFVAQHTRSPSDGSASSSNQ